MIDSDLRPYDVTWTGIHRVDAVWATSAREAALEAIKSHPAQLEGTMFFVSRWRGDVVHEFTLEELGVKPWDGRPKG